MIEVLTRIGNARSRLNVDRNDISLLADAAEMKYRIGDIREVDRLLQMYAASLRSKKSRGTHD